MLHILKFYEYLRSVPSIALLLPKPIQCFVLGQMSDQFVATFRESYTCIE